MTTDTDINPLVTYTCPLCGEQTQTAVAWCVIGHDCPNNTKERAKRKRDRKLTLFVRESPRVTVSWADELSEPDQDKLFEMLAEDNLGSTYEVV